MAAAGMIGGGDAAGGPDAVHDYGRVDVGAAGFTLPYWGELIVDSSGHFMATCHMLSDFAQNLSIASGYRILLDRQCAKAVNAPNPFILEAPLASGSTIKTFTVRGHDEVAALCFNNNFYLAHSDTTETADQLVHHIEALKRMDQYIGHLKWGEDIAVLCVKRFFRCDGYDFFFDRDGRRKITDSMIMLKVSLAMAKEVQKAHQRGVLHRDIKLENFMVNEVADSAGNTIYDVHLIDFGFARTLLSGQTTYEEHKKCCGTPDYIAPEVATPGLRKQFPITYSFSSDIFALGVAIVGLFNAGWINRFIMATKGTANGTYGINYHTQVMTSSPVPPVTFPTVSAVIKRILQFQFTADGAVDPASIDRPSIDEVIAALEEGVLTAERSAAAAVTAVKSVSAMPTALAFKRAQESAPDSTTTPLLEQEQKNAQNCCVIS